MLYWILLGFQFWFGFEVVSHLVTKIDLMGRIAMAIPVGILFCSLVFFVMSAFIGANVFHMLVHLAGLGIMSGMLLLRRLKGTRKIPVRLSRENTIAALVAFLLALIIVPHFYFPGPRILHSSVSQDMAEEISLINSFYRGVNSGFSDVFKIKHTACFKCNARTRWISAYHSSMLMIAGSSLRMAVILPSFFAFYSMVYLVISFGAGLSGSLMIGIGTMIVFLCLSGWGFTSWFYAKRRYDNNCDYVFNLGGGVTTMWSHPIMHYMMANRVVIVLLASAATIFNILRTACSRGEMIIIGGLLGITAALEHQGFLSLLIYLIGYFVITVLVIPGSKRDRVYENMKACAVSFAVVGLIPVLNMRKTGMDVKWLKLEPFWHDLTRDGYFYGPIVVWWKSTGLFFIVVLCFSWFALDIHQTLLFIPTLFPFVFGNLIQTQEYNRMNIHVFYPTWVMIGSAVFCITLRKFAQLAKDDEVRGVCIALAAMVYLTSTLSSIMGIVHIWSHQTIAWTEVDEKVADFIASNTKKKDIFVSLEDGYEPISALAGRRQFIHSPRHMWVLGYHWYYFRDELNTIRSNPTTDIVPKIKYVMEHDKKEQDKRLKQPDMKKAWNLFFEFESYHVYNRTI